MIKARIADELGMPTGKQKLQVEVSILFLMHARNGYVDVGVVPMIHTSNVHN